MPHLQSKIHKFLNRIHGPLRTSSSWLSIFFILLLLPCALCLGPLALGADAASVTFSWDSNPEPDLDGYMIYRNTSSPGPPYSYSDMLPEDELNDPLQPTVTLTGFQEGKEYHIALTAYNTEGIESDFSNNVCVQVEGGALVACSASTSSSGGGGGGGGGGCFISSTEHGSSTMPKFDIIQVLGEHKLPLLFLLALILLCAYKKARD